MVHPRILPRATQGHGIAASSAAPRAAEGMAAARRGGRISTRSWRGGPTPPPCPNHPPPPPPGFPGRRPEALGQPLPASLYQAPRRPSPAALLPITYPGHYEVGRVSRNGGIRWGSRWVNVSHVLAELDVGFE